jgi:two-component system nitrogen regulation sensor histidine kinase NtrY
MRLTWALVLAALGPMLIVVGATLLRAERRAESEAAARLDIARGQARILLDRHREEAMARLEEAATDLSQDLFAFEAPLGGESAARGEGSDGRGTSAGRGAGASVEALEKARTLAQRRGLDYLEILDDEGRILSNSRMDAEAQSGRTSALASLDESGVVVRQIPAEVSYPGRTRAAILGRRIVPLANVPLSVAGGRWLDERWLGVVAAITGGPAFLVDPSGAVVVRAGFPTAGDADIAPPGAAGAEPPTKGESGRVDRISGEIPVGEGWRVRVTAPAADVGRARRELGAIALGIAPFALATALVLGIVLAQGITRPIRALAARAEEISAREAAPIRLHPDVDEVRRLTLAFDQMLEALARSEQQRVSAERIAAWQEVAKRIAHEVKNPLSPIKLAVENLQRTRQKAPAELDRALDEESATILEEVESLRRLVDEFSQFARLPAPQLAECDPRAVVDSALALVAPRIAACGVSVDVVSDGAPPAIRADAEQIGRALKNVLLNALDAMETATEPRLRLVLSGPDAAGTGFLMIEVHDTGRGIEPPALKRIFEPYYTTRPERGGAGLGMAITHRIVHEHAGSIHAASAPGRGTTITIRLPIAGPPDSRV